MSKKTTSFGGSKGLPYDRKGMPKPNQIIAGDCIRFLNDGPDGWVDLVFADPPFNIGYLYHGYNDERKQEDYLKFQQGLDARPSTAR